MKIITENAIYVQKDDLTYLDKVDSIIPTSIYIKLNGIVIIDNSNKYEFVKFNEPKEIEFFKSLDWIVDYNKVKDLTDEQLKELAQSVLEEKNDIAQKLNSMSLEEKQKNMNIVSRCKLLDFKMDSLRYILSFKQGHQHIPFPIVPDSNGFSLVGNDNCAYEIKASLDPNKLLLFRKDGKKISSVDRIPQGFLHTGISIAVMQKNQNNELLGDYEISKYLTEDSQYLVIEFKIKSYENGYLKEQPPKKGVRKIIKRKNNNSKK